MMAQGLPAVESAAYLKAVLLAGLSRQQFDLTDGSLSVTGARMKATDFARWLAKATPQVSVSRAQKAVRTLCRSGLLAVTKAGYIRVSGWAQDQCGAPTAAAERQRRSRDARSRRLDLARGALAEFSGAAFEVDDLISMISAAAKCGRKIGGGLLKTLSECGEITPTEGGRLLVQTCVPINGDAPAALPAPREGDGPDGREGGCDMSQPDGVTCHNHYNHNHKRDANASHDHDGRAGGYARGDAGDEPPVRPLRDRTGTRFGGGGAGSAAGAEGGSRGIDIWSIPDGSLPETACRIFQPNEWAKTRGILESKLLNLRRQFGPQQAGIIFREEVSGVQTDVMCPGARELRFPERELCARLNERMGKPRRKERMA
jgi:hypothetical protein